MSGRLIAIGDIHGYSAALAAILRAVEPQAEDTVVALGDYCDRGPDTRGVLDLLIDLPAQCRLVPILGNHDEMLLEILAGAGGLLGDWLTFGGSDTLASYGCNSPEQIPGEHIAFLRDCAAHYESDGHLFVHASYRAHLPLERQPGDVLRWESLNYRHPGPHVSGKQAITGHTAQRNGEILDLGYLKCIDTCVYGGGWLTALDVHAERTWQADQNGRMRPAEA
jgi:serine/threonine protein phosphatase 1